MTTMREMIKEKDKKKEDKMQRLITSKASCSS